MRLEAVVSLGGLLLAIAAFYFPYRNSVRKEKAERLEKAETAQKQAMEKAVEDAVRPYKEQLATVTADRDYYRDFVMKHGLMFKHAPRPRPSPEADDGVTE